MESLEMVRILLLAMLTTIGCTRVENQPAVVRSTSAAGMSAEHGLDGSTVPQLVLATRWDLVVATVVKVDDANATNSMPPQVILQIDEVLRGDPTISRNDATWLPMPHDVDYIIEGRPITTNPRYMKWASTPLRGPAAGSRLLLFGEAKPLGSKTIFEIAPIGRFPFSPTDRNLALKAIRSQGKPTEVDDSTTPKETDQ